ncbi:MAG: NAD-dependent epimerase/dehydratase family protein [Lachnospiraceae bacterium]|nr:NAD-dependent epimerase/dehydratase family protein [Lachnospiraceae bacterium]
MKILVIGGSYFFGRVFVMQAAGIHDITVLNRGTYSMAALGAAEIKGDRRDKPLWKSLREDFDVVVDFCAYEKGDIAAVLENMAGHIGQYILISTVDVYERGMGKVLKTEQTALETRVFPGEAGAYIAGKVALEQEIRAQCAAKDIPYTVLRPAILYGPFNYAPRESAYIQMIVQTGLLPHITDAAGEFQFLYIKDAADAVLRCLLNEQTYGQAYNLCQDQILTYDIFYETLLKASHMQPQELPMTAEDALRQGIPLPFPVAEEESELYSNEKSKRELGIRYTEFSAGMEKTFRAFQNVYLTSPK